MKRYIDFVQKPKKGQAKVEEETAFVSVPEKKPARPTTSQPAAAARPVATRPVAARPATTAATTVHPAAAPVRPHYKPDFGPVRKKPLNASIAKPVAPRPAATAPVRPTVSRPTTATRPAAKPVEKPVENSTSDDFDSIFGIIEDYHPVNNQPPEIKKRPLSNGEPSSHHFFGRKSQSETKEAQAAEVIKEAEIVEQPKKTIPKTPFIRTTVEKRPLSNNFTPKKPAAPVKEPSDPATIIEKPEKDAHVGIIVTVVLTIVFGAALGTAAFLLLSK